MEIDIAADIDAVLVVDIGGFVAFVELKMGEWSWKRKAVRGHRQGKTCCGEGQPVRADEDKTADNIRARTCTIESERKTENNRQMRTNVDLV